MTINGSPGLLHYSRIIFALIVSIIPGIIFIRFLKQLPIKTMNRSIFAGLVYLGGSIGFEMIGVASIDNYGSDNLPFTLITAVEETLEMAGTVIFILAIEISLRSIPGSYIPCGMIENQLAVKDHFKCSRTH